MKKLVRISILAVACFLSSLVAKAQAVPSYCTVATPCAVLTWTNGADITATEVTNSNGIELTGPATAIVLRCTVTAAQPCTITNGALAVPSAWAVVPVTNGQSLLETSNTGGPFYDPSFTYGTKYSYTVDLTWTGVTPSLYAVPVQISSLGKGAVILTPVASSALTSSSTTFTWSAPSSNSTGVYLHVGTTAGATDLINLGPLLGNSVTVNLPTNGATVYVELDTNFGTPFAGTIADDVTYTENIGPPITPSNVSVVPTP